MAVNWPRLPALDSPDELDGPLPEGWRLDKIENLYELLPTGKRFDQKSSSPKGNIPVIDQSESGVIGWHNEEPGVKASKSRPVVTFANHTCEMRWMQQSFSVIQNVFPLIGRSGVCDTRFLYYGTKGRVHLEEYKGHFPDYRRKWIPVPPLPEQRAIAHILGTLDDKIENLRRQNETLEAMARALFKAWFVDFEPVRAKIEGRWRRGESLPGLPAHLYDLFPDRLVESELGEIPEGWDVGTLGRFFEIGLGGVWGNDEATARASIAVHCLRGIDCHDLAEGRVPDVPVRWVSPKQAADRHLSDGTVLIEGSGSFCGRSMIWKRAYGELIGEPVGYSNFCKRLDPICSTSQAIICWMQMRQAYRDGLLQSFQTGTAFPNFDVQGVLATFIVVVPSQPIADVFARMFDISQRINLMAQSRTLANLRDTLLPKLISGELRVKDAEAFLAERGL